MTATLPPLDWTSRLVVGPARATAQRRTAVSIVALVLTMVVAAIYVGLVTLHFNPSQKTIAVRVMLPESGGLLPNQDVTVRGIPVGHVESVYPAATGVEAVAVIDGDTRIPQGSPVSVSALSAAGEQYLDFRPVTDNGPPLTDGTVIQQDQVTVPVSLPRLLQTARGVSAQLDTKKLSAMLTELRISRQGPEKLRAILDGGTFLVSTLDSVLPETVSALRNSRVAFATLADVNDGLRDTVSNLHTVLDGVNSMEGGYRTLVKSGPGQLATIDGLLSDNRATMVQLLGNLTTVSQLVYLRVPALKALFPTDRGSALDAIATVFHDGGMWGIGDIYPRQSCDYGLPRHPVSQPDSVEPYLYTYCANPDPSFLVRGARNAPRPPGDDTAGPPPGVDPLAKTDPTPIGPHSIPNPYGGPKLPAVLPPD